MEKTQEVQTFSGQPAVRPVMQKLNLLMPGLWALFLAGVLAGACCTGSGMTESARHFLEIRAAADWKQAFTSTLISGTVLLAVILAGGFCAVGHAGTVAAVILRGMGAGGCIGELYRQLGTKGIGYAFLLVIIPEAIASFCFLEASKSSLKMSSRLWNVLTGEESSGLSTYARRYGGKSAVLIMLLILAAAVSALCTGIFGPLIF